MKAVFSFWAKPLAARVGAFGEFLRLEDFLRSWALSAQLAARHYSEVELVTDSAGKALLYDALGLPFTSVSTALDEIPGHIPTFHWALSKLVAYALQSAPFVHIDSDVYLWQRLPERLERAPLFAQSLESDVMHVHYYRDAYQAMLQHLRWLPPSFAFRADLSARPCAVNAGVLGGRDVAHINLYAQQALELVLHTENQVGWQSIHEIIKTQPRFPINAIPVVVEQYLFHRVALWANKWDQVEFLIDEREAFEDVARSKAACQRLGYTHLMSPQAKHDREIMGRLAQRLENEFPPFSVRINQFREVNRDHPVLGPFCQKSTD